MDVVGDDMAEKTHQVSRLNPEEASRDSVSRPLPTDNEEQRGQRGTSNPSCSEVVDSGALPLKLYPEAHELPPRPPPANECNYTHYYAVDVGKEHHDQYVFRHANGLCVVGLAPSHTALKTTVGVTAVDFNVGKTSRADMKAVGKRKKNATVLEGNSVLCKVMAGEMFFLIRCCVRGTLLEVNQRLIQDPQLLISHADTEGYIAILMPRPEDWAKAEKSLLTRDQYKVQRGL